MRNVSQRQFNLDNTRAGGEIAHVARLAKIATCCALIVGAAYFVLVYTLASR
jgi:hypothetical protein